MPVINAFSLSLILGACFGLSACTTLDNATGRLGGLITPYQVEVVQGNFVSKEQKDALQVGMPRAQVRDILGSPLVTSAFHADRWEYVFSIRRQGAQPQQRKLTVYFQGDALAKVEGDALISEAEFVDSLSAGRQLGQAPALQMTKDLPSATQNPAAAATPAVVSSPAVQQRNYPPLEVTR